ncbi:MAG TPA: response regulator [Candidatus Angelobacter sp.]|jgi:two-component system response regulator HydG|nr:response regulator [Candidatus Angelobacter sp.]
MSDPGTYRILVVDDEASVLVTYQLILEQQGYQVSACATSVDAISALRRQDFDLVLCDYSLEEQHTGFEVIAEARRRRPEVPAALLTGYATKETADEASGQNIGIMFKPIEIEEFLATTSKMLRRDHEPEQESGEKDSRRAQSGAKK